MAAADGPAQGAHLDLQLFLEFIQQVKRVLPFEVHLVDENDNGRVSHAAHLHQTLGLGLYTFHAIHDEDDAVHSGQRAVCVFSEILVTGRVQEVDEAVLVMEGHDRGRYRNPTLALDFHKIRRGGFGDLVVLHRAGRLNRPTEQQELFGQGRLSGIRVADDGEGPSPLNLVLNCAHGGANLRCRSANCR